MVDRTLNLYQDTSTTQNSETKNILSQPKYGIESKSSTTATDDQQAPIHNITLTNGPVSENEKVISGDVKLKQGNEDQAPLTQVSNEVTQLSVSPKSTYLIEDFTFQAPTISIEKDDSENAEQVNDSMSKKAKHTQMSLESEASKNSNSNQTLSEVKQNHTFQNPYLVEVGRNINLKIGQMKQLTNEVVKEFNDNEMKQLMHEKDQDRI